MITQKEIKNRLKNMDKRFILATVSDDVGGVIEEDSYRIYPTE